MKKLSKTKNENAKDTLKKIITLCQSVQDKGLNPFYVRIEELLEIIKKYFPSWKNLDELCLDAEAINQIATIIKSQSDWIQKRANTLYRDPFLLDEKIRKLSVETLNEIFLKVWHPIVEFEKISISSLKKALKYWNELLPLNKRWINTDSMKNLLQPISYQEMVKNGVLSDESFNTKLDNLWRDLKKITEVKGKIEYWEFIGRKTFNETAERAYLTSFLITYGYAVLEISILQEIIFIKAYDKIIEKSEMPTFSFPISVNYEDWIEWCENQKI